ncbi:MAG: histidine triad nucleotide-binding protein [bacterium]
MSDCIFCKIVDGEIPADVVYENDHVVVFRDLNPQAPVHLLAIPRKHIASINEVAEDDAETMGQLFLAAKAVAEQEGFSGQGYRTTMNCGEQAGQTVFHAHLHILSGRPFSWPPG